MEDITEKGQASPKEVLQAERPPIYFCLGGHKLGSIKYLSSFADKAESFLGKSKEGKVVMFSEGADLPQDICRMVEEDVDNGVRPIVAYGAGLLAFALRRKLSGQPDEFSIAQISIIDELAVKYPGRIELLLEASEQEITGQNKILQQLKEEDIDNIVTFLGEKGEFSAALPFFKKRLQAQVEEGLTREQVIIDRLKEAAEKENVLAVVVRIGGAHSFIAHKLKKEGYDVEIEFDRESEQGIHVFNQATRLMRSLRLYPDRPISELEWLKCLAGTFLEMEICDRRQIKPGDKDYHEAVNLANRTIREKLATMEQIRNFEEEIREKGFEKACQSLLGSGE